MRRAGRFLWIDWAQASGQLFSSSGEFGLDRFEGEHDGYRSLGVKHSRVVQWLKGEGWVIVDDIEGAGEHDVRLHWLTPDLPYVVSDAPFRVVFRSGEAQIRWSIFASVPGGAGVLRAGIRAWADSTQRHTDADTQLLGWESLTYGDLRPAVSLIYETRSQMPVRFVTAVLTGERCRVAADGGELVILKDGSREESRDSSELYRVRLSTKASREEAERAAVSLSRL